LGGAEPVSALAGYDAAAFATIGLAEPKQAQPAKAGGARRDRTADLVIANDALSQLSYGPFASRPVNERRPASGAIYNPHQGQVKNSEIAVFRGFCRELPLFGQGGTDI
jgi:hypothetical protein